ncbi:hypothetical protein FRC00_014617 [Tulasnella sp. 408]|nr:hypothetical protein FRC00_014617 [Tulasnella sp. 408]
MKLTTLYLTSIALLPSLIAAVAIPDASPRDGTLSKRGGEVVYLADCTRKSVSTGSQYPASYGAWYADVDNSLSGNDAPISAGKDLSKMFTGKTPTSSYRRTLTQTPRAEHLAIGLAGLNAPPMERHSTAIRCTFTRYTRMGQF